MTATPSRRVVLGGTALAGSAIALSSCGGDGRNADGKIELTMAAWSIDTTPEFALLKKGFEKAHPDAVITLKEYSADDYDTQLTTDLSSGSAPDLIPLKNFKTYYYLQSNGALADLTEVASKVKGQDGLDLSSMEVEGAYYTLPYRQDSWLVYYNRDLFEKAGEGTPDGTWNWDDYVEAASRLTKGLSGEKGKPKGAYQHIWQSVVQGFALAQNKGAALDSGDLSYLSPNYEKALAMQDDGSCETFSTAQSQSLGYQAQFGTQKAAMMTMGSWYIATLLAQRESGDADTFEWGLAPAPQAEKGGDQPVTFGDPTGMAVNAKTSGDKLEMATAFVEYVVSEDCAKALAGIGITPSVFSDEVVDVIFGLDGMPGDDLSREAFQTKQTKPESPVGPHTNDIQTVLSDTHSEIMTESSSLEAALKSTEKRLVDEALTS